MTAQGDVEWQHLWFQLRAHGWTSLAVMGVGSAADAGEVAVRLAAVGNLDTKVPVRMVSAVGMSIEDVAGVLALLGEPTLTVVACDSPRSNPAMIPIVQAASGVVLVVRLGESLLHSVRRAVDSVGREKVLATVSVG